MLKSNRWTEKIIGDRKIVPPLRWIVLAIALLAGGEIGLLLPSLISRVSPAIDRFEGSIVTLSPIFWGLVVGTLIMTVIIMLRQDEFAANVVIATSIILDWYLHINFVALLIALILLLVFFLTRSPRYPWAEPRALWLWTLFLVLIIFAATRGSLTTYEALYYYNYFTFGAFIMLWLGTVISRNVTSARRFFKILTGFGALVAIHAIIQATTGKFLFWSTVNDSYYASLSNFIFVPGLDTQRVGSFLLNPDWAGPFFAVIFFIAIGLFIGSISLSGKLLYLIETSLLLIALLFTYTYGAMIGACVGFIVLLAFIGSYKYRIQLLSVLFLFLLVIIGFFQTQIYLLVVRFDPKDSLIRIGAWKTALQVINAFPLTGVGLGLYNYLSRADPYRVPAQYQPLAHPLNSYLEFAAGGGIPVLVAFIALQAFALWLALRNWARLDIPTRALFSGCIAAIITLSIDSLTNNIWTNPPLATLGWLVLGVISSPLLLKTLDHQITKEQKT